MVRGRNQASEPRVRARVRSRTREQDTNMVGNKAGTGEIAAAGIKVLSNWQSAAAAELKGRPAGSFQPIG